MCLGLTVAQKTETHPLVGAGADSSREHTQNSWAMEALANFDQKVHSRIIPKIFNIGCVPTTTIRLLEKCSTFVGIEPLENQLQINVRHTI